MKKSYLISILVLLFLFSNTIQAKHKVGLIVQIDSSTLTHTHIGWTIFENFTNTYPMPFDLNEFCTKAATEEFGSGYSTLEFIDVDIRVYEEYLDKKARLTRKEFKTYREKWFDDLKDEYQINALMVIADSYLNVLLHPSISIIGKGLYTGTSDEAGSTYLQIEAYLFWKSKPKRAWDSNVAVSINDIRILKKEEPKYTEEDLLKLEPKMKELIQLQLKGIENHEQFRNMKLYLNEQY